MFDELGPSAQISIVADGGASVDDAFDLLGDDAVIVGTGEISNVGAGTFGVVVFISVVLRIVVVVVVIVVVVLNGEEMTKRVYEVELFFAFELGPYVLIVHRRG